MSRATRASTSLDDGYGITNDDLYNTAKKQKVELKRGDYVIVRTGMMERCQKAGSWDGYPGGDAPGFSFETLDFIKQTQLAALASDTWGCEVRPNESEEGINQPWHWITIPIMGMTMGEIFQLKELADDCEQDKVYEFLFVAPAIPITGRGRLAGQSAGDQIAKQALQELWSMAKAISCHPYRRRMAQAAHARAVPDHAQARHRDAGKLRADCTRSAPARFAAPACDQPLFVVQAQVRKRHRLAELQRSDARRGRDEPTAATAWCATKCIAAAAAAISAMCSMMGRRRPHLRYCINGVALKFEPAESMTTVGHNAKRVGAEVLADMLAGYGVTHVFMVPAVLRRTFAEMERRTKIARVHCHGEKSAAYMADGYARASGKPGICMAQVIGALNLAAGLRDAYLAHSPVIAMTGGRDPKTKFRKVYQEIDDVPAFEPVTKMNVTIDDVARIPDMVRQAFRTATTGAPGPVHLQFRGNEGQVDLDEAEMDALVEAQFARVPPFRPEPEAAHVKAALELLQKAERPIIVAGGGARASGAGKELVALAEALQIPIATSLNGKDIIPGTHALSVGVVGSYSRESANRAVNRADLVCFIGSETGGMTTHFWAVPKIGIPAIQIDIEPESLGRNYPLVASVLGDARSVLVRMLGQIDKSSAAKRAAWVKEISDLRGEWCAKYKPLLDRTRCRSTRRGSVPS